MKERCDGELRIQIPNNDYNARRSPIKRRRIRNFFYSRISCNLYIRSTTTSILYVQLFFVDIEIILLIFRNAALQNKNSKLAFPLTNK